MKCNPKCEENCHTEEVWFLTMSGFCTNVVSWGWMSWANHKEPALKDDCSRTCEFDIPCSKCIMNSTFAHLHHSCPHVGRTFLSCLDQGRTFEVSSLATKGLSPDGSPSDPFINVNLSMFSPPPTTALQKKIQLCIMIDEDCSLVKPLATSPSFVLVILHTHTGRYVLIAHLSNPLACKAIWHRDFSSVFVAAVNLWLQTVTGTWEALKTYLLNESVRFLSVVSQHISHIFWWLDPRPSAHQKSFYTQTQNPIPITGFVTWSLRNNI